MTAPVRTFAASAVVAARFLPVWIAFAVLAAVAAIIAPEALQHTSWSYVLPYMTILAVAALGQMLVVMQAGIDLSTPGVISLGGNLIVGVSVGSNHRLALGILACIGLGAMVGLVNGVLVGDREAEPADRHAGRRADRVRVEPEVLARRHELVSGAGSALVLGGGEATRHQRRLLDGSRSHGRRRARASLHGLRATFSGSGRKSESRMDGRAACSNVTSSSRTRRRASSTGLLPSSSPASASTSTRPSAPATCSRRSLQSSLPGASLSGGLASATSTWMAALALTFLTQMLLILGLSAAMQYIVYGAAIIAGMLVSGDRIASLLGRVLRPVEATAGNHPQVDLKTS